MAINGWFRSRLSRLLYGDHVQQSHVALWYYEQLVYDHWTEWIIEIGMGCGASSAYFSTLAFCKGIPYLGIDDLKGDYEPPVYNREKNLEVVRRMGGTILVADEFSEESVAAIKEIASDTPGFILCDGGDKPREIMELATLCCPGSIVAGHDWVAKPQRGFWSDRDLGDRSRVDFYEPANAKASALGAVFAVLRVK